MNALYIMIPLAMLLAGGFVGAFIWATKSGQWDDLDLAAHKAMTEPNSKGEPQE